MKKIMLFVLISVFVAVPAAAVTMPPAVDDLVEMWLESIIGKTYNDPFVNFLGRHTGGFPGGQGFPNFNPGFPWSHAVVVLGANNPGGPVEVFVFGPPANGTPTGETTQLMSIANDIGNGQNDSNGLPNGTSVPEPTTLLLLGCGLVGLAAFGRKLKKK